MTDLNDSLAEKLLGFTPHESNGSGITWWWCDPAQCPIDDESTPHAQPPDLSGSWEGCGMILEALYERGYTVSLLKRAHDGAWLAILTGSGLVTSRWAEEHEEAPMAVALVAQSALEDGE